VKFSIYSEIQWWPGKEPAQVYAEVLEQIENADRLGYDAYAAIEHYYFPKFSASPDPISLFAAATQRTSRINFRTLVHVLPYHNPMILASRIAFADVLLGGRYEFGVGRGHGWIPRRAGVEYAEMVERYDESLEILFTALESKGEPFSYEGKFFNIHDARIVPPPTRKFRVFTGGTSDKTYVLAATKGWGVVVPPLLPYEALREQLDLYRATCAEHGNEPDIVWIHACYLDEDRDTAIREAEKGIKGFLAGNASPLVEHERRPAVELTAAG
jgi:alkanesulfonate monooxygenase SsuD/methylene tetrahydromethanopterin reductase-like flavin-dependent oxidoreductase (luciferase family)